MVPGCGVEPGMAFQGLGGILRHGAALAENVLFHVLLVRIKKTGLY